MKVKVPLMLLLTLVASAAYMFGTSKGRHQRAVVVARIRNSEPLENATDKESEASA